MRFLLFVFIIIALFVILTKLGAYYYQDDFNHPLKIGEVTLDVEIADTEAKRAQGLSGTERLEKNAGMLFIFGKEGYYGIWMKDMNFPIDIAWLDKNKKITHIENNITPETYPKVFNSIIPGLYVLEVGAGFLGKNNIKIGDFVAF